MPSALVTGSSGFVGRHLVPKLEAAGYDVAPVDIADDPHHDARYLAKVEGFKWDVIVHLAANIVDVDTRSKGGIGMFDDIALDLAVLKYVEANPPSEAFICMSSCAVDNTADPYGWVKITLEVMADRLRAKGVPIVILRPFSGYGADQSDSYPFPAILKRALNHEDPLIVWGGSQVRDWVHIEDLTDAIVHGIKHFPRGIPIDIGTGIGTSFFDLATKMAKAADYSPRIVGDLTKAQSSDRRVADTTLARAHGFEAKTSLATGIQKAARELACLR